MIDREILIKLLSLDLNAEGYLVGSSVANPLSKEDSALLSDHEKQTQFRVAWQLYNLNRKEDNGSVPESLRNKAMSSFHDNQTHVRETNERLRIMGPQMDVVRKARQIIGGVLPPIQLVWDEIWPLCTFGPGTFHGAIKELRETGFSTHYKVGGDQTVTAEAKVFAIRVIQRHFPKWAENLSRWCRHLTVVEGNRLSHVPKDVNKCRPIAIEPSLNVFLQQGLGRWIGRHMKYIGFADIMDGQEVNRRKAGDLANATIDLSSASDTISLELCKQILPVEWFDVLDAVRSHRWEFRGTSGTYENISSQGNAFTFPLETLIFKAIVMAATGLSSKSVTVYGDDIIVPSSKMADAVDGLTSVGFIVNTDKSYGGYHETDAKHFRESCGADYYQGVLVTPVYYRTNARTWSDVAVLYNRLLETWGILPRVHNYLASLIPQKKQLWGPRFFITDQPEVWAGSETMKVRNLGLNSEVSVYSSWLWSNVLHPMPFTGKRWGTRDRVIRKDLVLSEEVSKEVFLLGSSDTVPRRAREVIQKVHTIWPDDDLIRSSLSGDASGALLVRALGGRTFKF